MACSLRSLYVPYKSRGFRYLYLFSMMRNWLAISILFYDCAMGYMPGLIGFDCVCRVLVGVIQQLGHYVVRLFHIYFLELRDMAHVF